MERKEVIDTLREMVDATETLITDQKYINALYYAIGFLSTVKEPQKLNVNNSP